MRRVVHPEISPFLSHARRTLPQVVAIGLVLAASSAWAGDAVSALGRLEPGEGVIRVSGPSGQSRVIASLPVNEGDFVEKGQLLAVLDHHGVELAMVDQHRAELASAKQRVERLRGLSKRSAGSRADLEDAEADRRVAEAGVQAARARLALQEVRAPIAGQILEIHARPGEKIGSDGVLALGDTRQMVAVAEVYETDVASVTPGSRAVIRSAALPAPVSGIVERVGLWIGRQDVLDTDPVAKIDSRVVEVRIRLEPDTEALSSLVSKLTHLQVEVQIDPAEGDQPSGDRP